MGFRFRRSIGIIPGVRVNLGKRGVSLSVGPRGAKVTVGPTGIRQTVGIPGSGLSHTSHTAWGGGATGRRQRRSAASDGTSLVAPLSGGGPVAVRSGIGGGYLVAAVGAFVLGLAVPWTFFLSVPLLIAIGWVRRNGRVSDDALQRSLAEVHLPAAPLDERLQSGGAVAWSRGDRSGGRTRIDAAPARREPPDDWRLVVGCPSAPPEAPLSVLAQEIRDAAQGGWEFRLLAQVIADEVERVADAHRRAFASRRTVTGETVRAADASTWFANRIHDMAVTTETLGSAPFLYALTVAVGPPGQPGDADAIIRVGWELADAYSRAVAWRLRVRGATVPTRWKPVQAPLARYCDNIIAEIAGFGDRMLAAVRQAERAPREGEPLPSMTLTLTLTIPEDAERELSAAIAMARGEG